MGEKKLISPILERGILNLLKINRVLNKMFEQKVELSGYKKTTSVTTTPATLQVDFPATTISREQRTGIVLLSTMAAFGLVLCFFVAFQAAAARRYYVDNTKTSSNNRGTFKHPFTNIQDCVNKVKAGDECRITAGRYHEDVVINGKQGIVISGSEKTRPTLDGTVVIKPKLGWKPLNPTSNIYTAKIDSDVSQLFVDGEMMTNARWPNSLWSDRSIFNGSLWADLDDNSVRGNIINKGDSLAASKLNMTGAMAVLNIGSYCTFVAKAEEHWPGKNSFKYKDTFGDVHFTAKISRYYMEDKLELLDQAEEWFFDNGTKMLYLWTKDNDSPANHEVRGKVQTYAIKITNSSNIVVKNLDFFATTLEAKTISMTNTIDALTLQSLNFKFPSYSKRMLGDPSPPQWTRIYAFARRRGVEKYGAFQIRNCTFFGSDGVVLDYRGANTVVANNLFEYNDWSGANMLTANGGSQTVQSKGVNDTFVRNTLRYNGASAGLRPGTRPIIQLNHIYQQCWGFIQNDGAGVQVMRKQQPGSQITQNWVHSSPKYGLRFDGEPPKIGTRGTMKQNVVFNCGGIMVKGDFHKALNNLAFDKRSGRSSDKQGDGCTLCVLKYVRKNPGMINNNTVVVGNAADVANGGKIKKHTYWPIAGIMVKDNVIGNVRDEIMDADNFDFRPRFESQYRHHRAGAYTYQAKRKAYWIPGRKLFKASTPVPPDGSKTVSVDTRDAVMWLHGLNARTHDVYFGTDRTLVEDAVDDKSPAYFKSTANKLGNIVYFDGKLENSKTYFWRVDAVISKTVKFKGDVWSFTTK